MPNALPKLPDYSHPTHMIIGGEIRDASWTLVFEHVSDPRPKQAIPLGCWLSLRRTGHPLNRVGIIMEETDNITPLKNHLDRVPLLALNIHSITDGRSLSHAYRIRRLWRYSGTLLAFGDIRRDQLPYMSVCGIDAFYLRYDQDIEAAVAACGHQLR
ncbi:MAG: DUF934 domain-containing protein [Myxococcota bacterium]|nr:DUF934 domain-containing protein [Myxococcota bacterium]